MATTDEMQIGLVEVLRERAQLTVAGGAFAIGCGSPCEAPRPAGEP